MSFWEIVAAVVLGETIARLLALLIRAAFEKSLEGDYFDE